VPFFGLTSAAEIDSFGLGIKITSIASDYCSYQREADTRSLTGERMIKVFTALTERRKNSNAVRNSVKFWRHFKKT
jgi:hypothetical protein